jgi:4-hydroxybenzoate polyprenyltransferase
VGGKLGLNKWFSAFITASERGLKFLTLNSLFLALNGSMVVVFSYALYGIEMAPILLLLAFLITFSVYGMNKVTDKVEDSINKPETVSGKTHYLVSSIAAMLVSLAVGALMGITVFVILIVPLIIGVVYSVKLSKATPRLKDVVGVKSGVVAFSWAFTGSLLPASLQAVDHEKIVLVFIFIFIQLFVNTILFDVLDMKGDWHAGVKTIPIALGRTKTKNLLLLVNGALWPWMAFCFFSGFFLKYLPALILGGLYGYAIIWGILGCDCPRLLADIVVDGEWLPIVAMIKTILR